MQALNRLVLIAAVLRRKPIKMSNAQLLQLGKIFYRAEAAGRCSSLWAFDARQRLSERGGSAPASAVLDLIGPQARAYPGFEAPDFFRRGNDPAQAHGPRHQQWRDNKGFLSGISSRQERGGSDCVVARVEIIAHAGEDAAKHLCREHAGVGVVTRAVIAGEHPHVSDVMSNPMSERG